MSMPKKKHGHFADEMDAYLIKGAAEASSEEYRELFEIGRMLASRDCSKESNKAAMYRKLKQTSTDIDKERSSMKTNKKWTRLATTAASLAAVSIISLAAVQPSSASDWVGKIITTISLKHISVSQSEPTPVDPQLAEGGISITALPDGGTLMTSHPDNPTLPGPHKLTVQDAQSLNQYTSFNVLLPGYQPEGYAFDRAEFYKDDRGEVRDSKYINIYFKHSSTGKEIFMQQRLADEDTAYHVATDETVEALQINGADAALSGERTIDWEAGGVLYSLTAKDLPRKEIIKIAESIR